MPRASPDFSRHEKGSFKRLLIILDVNNGRQWYNSCKNIATESITTISDINNNRDPVITKVVGEMLVKVSPRCFIMCKATLPPGLRRL